MFVFKINKALTLAVNLLPEWNRRQARALKDEIEKESNDDGISYIFMNFMIRSYKYFKIWTKDFENDDLFNLLFQKMRIQLENESNSQYIPDFAKVFLELLSRNSENKSIDAAKFK